MNKALKNILTLAFLFVLMIACSGNYEENIKKCKEIKKGMDEAEVTKIMGDPVNRSEDKSLDEEEYYILYYGMPAMASTGIDIYFDSKTHKVTEVFCGG